MAENVTDWDAVRENREQVRSAIRERITKGVGDNLQGLLDLLDKAADLEVVMWAYCSKCGEKVQVDYPDFKGFASIWKLALEHGLGKPPQVIDQNVDVNVNLGALDGLPSEELARFLPPGHPLRQAALPVVEAK